MTVSRFPLALLVLTGACKSSLDVGMLTVDAASPADARMDTRSLAAADGRADVALASVAGSDALAQSYFPLAKDFYWSYRVTQPFGPPFTKVQTVQGMERVGGEGRDRNKVVFVLLTTKRSGREEPANDQTQSWQSWEGDVLVRYREQSFARGTARPNLDEFWTPPRGRLDISPDRMHVGASWLEPFFETRQVPGAPAQPPIMRTRSWMVVSLDESVTVPKGTFRCLRVRVGSGLSGWKDYWFARGVGKVKETGGQTEELIDFNTDVAARGAGHPG